MTEPAAPAGAVPSSVPEGYQLRKEGAASILQQGNDVFFNPAQVVNRDLSVMVLQQFQQIRKQEGSLKAPGRKPKPPPKTAHQPAQPDGLRVLEGLAASGLRSFRYASEVEGIRRVDANDMDADAVANIRQNCAWNPSVAGRVVPTQGDARILMMQNEGAYDAVDLDPYGSPNTLLDGAVQAVAEGGLLMITATDMAVLCGNSSEACWAKYGSYPVHRPYCHEMALRILLACLEGHANRYKRYIIPVLSCSIDFYVRIFVRVYTSAVVVKDSATKLAYLWQSSGCDSFHLQPVGRKGVKGNSVKHMPGAGPAVAEACPQTGSGWLMGGPIWAAPLHDPTWVSSLLHKLQSDPSRYSGYGKINGVLTNISEELVDAPLYFSLHDLCKTVHCCPPRAEVFKSALLNAGYRVSGTHANPLGIKTDAPFDVVWDIVRGWVAEHPVKPQDPSTYAAKILAKPPEHKANFSRAQGSISRSQVQKVARYPLNPEPNWGPRPKHGRFIKETEPGGGPQVNGEQQPASTQPVAMSDDLAIDLQDGPSA